MRASSSLHSDRVGPSGVRVSASNAVRRCVSVEQEQSIFSTQNIAIVFKFHTKRENAIKEMKKCCGFEPPWPLPSQTRSPPPRLEWWAQMEVSFCPGPATPTPARVTWWSGRTPPACTTALSTGSRWPPRAPTSPSYQVHTVGSTVAGNA